jgi:hypothetical protein
MKTVHVLAAGVLAVVTSLGSGLPAVRGQAAPPEGAASVVRIGIFDSRAVAVAYARSEGFKRRASEIYERGRELEKAGDKQRLAVLKKEAQEEQRRLHLQGFSNMPIDDILEKMEPALPEIMSKAGVAAIVPSVAFHDATVEVVDVTDALVDHFEPTDETRKIIVDLLKRPPVSPEVAVDH